MFLFVHKQFQLELFVMLLVFIEITKYVTLHLISGHALLKSQCEALDVWFTVTKNGSVSTAYCTCTVGNSVACNHIGAWLFAAEDAYRRKCAQEDNTTCTDVLAV